MATKKKAAAKKSADKIDLTRRSAYACDPWEATIIGIDTPHKRGEHPLRDTDERLFGPLDEARVLNMMEYGVLDPVKVRREGDMLVVVDGRQRVRHAREANERLKVQGKPTLSLPILFRSGDDKRLVGEMVSQNAQRLEDTVLCKAEKAQQMLDYGGSIQDVALAYGVTDTAVRGWLRLLSADKSVRDAVTKGKIGATAATKLAGLDRDKQKEGLKALLSAAKSKGSTVDDAAQVAAKLRKTASDGAAEGDVSVTVPVVRPPTKGRLRQLSDIPSLGRNVHPDAQAMLLWVLGKGSPHDIPGLAQALKDAGLEKELAKYADDAAGKGGGA